MRSLVAHYPSSQYPQSILLLEESQFKGRKRCSISILYLLAHSSSYLLYSIEYDTLHIVIGQQQAENSNHRLFLEAQFYSSSSSILDLSSRSFWRGK